MRYAILLVGFLLVGCENPQLTDHRSCLSYGMSPGTESYMNCRMALDRNRAMWMGNMTNSIPPPVNYDFGQAPMSSGIQWPNF